MALMLLSIIPFKGNTQDKEVEAQYHYTQAESLYDKDQFVEAYQSLFECEKILGKTNSKILYLKIKSMDKIGIDLENNFRHDTTLNNALRKEIKTFFEITDVNKYPKEKYFDIIEIKKRIELLSTEQYLNIYKKERDFEEKVELVVKYCPGKNCLSNMFFLSRYMDNNTRLMFYQIGFLYPTPAPGEIATYLDTLFTYFKLPDFVTSVDYVDKIESIRNILCNYIADKNYEHKEIFNVFFEKYSELADYLDESLLDTYIKSVNLFHETFWVNPGSNFDKHFLKYYYKEDNLNLYFGKIFFKIQKRGYFDRILTLSNHQKAVYKELNLFQKSN